MNEQEYMTERVDDQIAWYGKKSSINKTYHIWCNGLIIFFGTMIPFVAATMPKLEDANRMAAAFGVLTAFFSGISALLKFNEKWANYRMTAEALYREKFLYRTRSGPYNTGADPFKAFVVNVEQLLGTENKGWSQMVTSAPAPTDTEVTPP